MESILILSAGRRVGLVRLFQQVAATRKLRVITADMNPKMSSACYVSSKSYPLPHVLSTEYAEALRHLCKMESVRLVIPTLDTELPVLSMLRDQMVGDGCNVIVSDSSFVSICADKRQTATWFTTKGLESPRIYNSDALQYPLIVKPFDGSLSKGIHIANSKESLSSTIFAEPKNIFCEYLDPANHDEFTCDAYYTASGELRCVVPRLRIEVRGGEIAKGRTERNEIVSMFVEKLSRLKGARGCLTFQIMRNRTNGLLKLIEVNARFGGGYPLTAASGAHYHEMLISEYIENQKLEFFNNWKDGLTMLRYDDAIIF